jgi:hypothetical protein
MKETLQFYANRVASSVWRRTAPDVIVQRAIRGSLMSVSLRDHALWVFRGASADAELLPIPQGSRVWDLGCNIGLYSVRAAQLGCTVTAFDIGETNVLCLNQTARMHGYAIQAVHCPVTVDAERWSPARTAHTENAMTTGGDRYSLSYAMAAWKYGTPTFIKMDIQGGEIPFLRSVSFKEWAFTNRIQLYVEVHGDAERYLWPEFKQVGRIQYFFKP